MKFKFLRLNLKVLKKFEGVLDTLVSFLVKKQSLYEFPTTQVTLLAIQKRELSIRSLFLANFSLSID
ncbi:hypothetical protein BpHYR1_022783 [Brachionus plicatilis]|uniref:Uncharacterized protein n=1 Tax=Brachionus plicatilis TaxID=10195 RepID=A0A3M7QKR9_BRAPC|nr:hypothetical protein BpHYR1_022783 [Brachionus plicatilis]